jgi:hypothetical protein
MIIGVMRFAYSTKEAGYTAGQKDDVLASDSHLTHRLHIERDRARGKVSFVPRLEAMPLARPQDQLTWGDGSLSGADYRVRP